MATWQFHTDVLAPSLALYMSKKAPLHCRGHGRMNVGTSQEE